MALKVHKVFKVLLALKAPPGSELIDGATSITVAAGASARIICAATDVWITI